MRFDFLENATAPTRSASSKQSYFQFTAGTVTLAFVPEEDEDALRESMMDALDAGAATPVPRERFPAHPMFDPRTSITLLIPVPDFRQMAYVPLTTWWRMRGSHQQLSS